MSNARTRSRTAAAGPWLTIGLLLLGAIGTVAGLHFVGGVDLPMLGLVHKNAAAKSSVGTVQVVVLSQPLRAYQQIEFTDLLDAQTQSFRRVSLSQERASELDALTEPNQIIGRVLARDKAAGKFFTEADFLPPGSRPSPTAGIQEGQRGLQVDIAKIEGLALLKRNDRFDVLAVRRPAAAAEAGNDTAVDPSVLAAEKDQKTWDAASKIVVTDGRIVEPVPPPVKAGQPPRGSAFIAVAEAEVEQLVRMLGLADTKLICVSRSGRADVTANALPDQVAAPAPDVVEEFHGSKVKRSVVPSGDAPAKDVGVSTKTAPSDDAKKDPK